MIASQLLLPPGVCNANDRLVPAGKVFIRLLARPLPAEIAAVNNAELARDLSLEAAATLSTLGALHVLTGSLVMLSSRDGQPAHPARLHVLPTDGVAQDGIIYCSPLLCHNIGALVRCP